MYLVYPGDDYEMKSTFGVADPRKQHIWMIFRKDKGQWTCSLVSPKETFPLAIILEKKNTVSLKLDYSAFITGG